MTGGRVIEARQEPELDKVSLFVYTGPGKSGVRVDVLINEKSRTISKGDMVWWQGESLYWSPYKTYATEERVGPTDIELVRKGYSRKSDMPT